MIKRILLLLLAAQGGAVLALAWAGAHYGQLAPAAALALALAVLLLVRLAITLNNFQLSRLMGSATPAAHRIGPGGWLRLLMREFGATMLASSWTMLRPLGWQVPAHARGLPVLLLHGYVCNGGYWAQLSKRLRAAGIAHYAIDLEPPMAAIDDYVPQVQAAVERLRAATGAAQVVIVAHSMGGLVARAWLRRHGGAQVARVITLGTPHHGTGLARFGPGHNARQMRRQHQWLTELAATDTPARRALLTSIYSWHDNIIAPQDSCCLPGARNIAFGAIGHVALGGAAPVLDCVMKEIQALSSPRDAIDSAPQLR